METRLGKFLRKATEYLTYLFIFILPWQLKLIFRAAETNYTEISFYFSQGLLLLILILFLWRRLKDTEKEKEVPAIIYSLAALTFFVFISIFFALNKALATYHYFIFLSALSLFFIIRAGTMPRNYKDPILNKINLIYSFLAAALVQAILGIYQFLTQSSFAFKYLGIAAHNTSTLGTAVIETASGRWLRAYGGLDHPNILGGFLAIALILAAYLLAKKKMLNTRREVRSSIFLFIFYFITLYALFFTFSRSAWLALAAGFFALLIALIVNKDKWVLGRFIALIFFSAALVGIAAAPFQELLMVRIDATTRLEQKSITERTNYIFQARNLIAKNFLTGVGIGNYTTAIAVADNNKKPAYEYQPVHNVFLLLWAEGGLFSFLAFLVFLFLLIKNGRREIYAFAILAPLLILLLLDHYLFSLPFGILFFFLVLGLI